MSRQQILEKVIQKAIDGGWSYWPVGKDGWTKEKEVAYHFEKADEADPNGGELAYWANIIFNHDFAKALWGEEPEYTLETRDQYGSLTVNADTFMLANWQYHLQQMVIADDPIKYLSEHI